MPKFKSSQPEPSVTHIHNQQASRAAVILTYAFVIAIGILVLYIWVVGVLDDIGLDAEKTILNFLFWPFFIAGWILFLSRIWNYIEDGRHARKLEMEQLRLERMTLQHKLQTSVSVDTRETDPDTKRRNSLIVALVQDALERDEHNFSYRKAGNYVLVNEKDPLGKDSKIVAAALTWLRDNKLVVGNRLVDNVTLFDVQQSLYLPIVGNTRLLSSSSGQSDGIN